MALKEEFISSGQWLFRWRSYLPLLLIILIIFCMTSKDFSRNRFFISLTWELAVFAISLLGLAVRVYAVGHTPSGTSGRNRASQVAEVLNRTGAYSLVRHPLYLGNFLIWSGAALFIHIWWVVVITALFFWLYYERIMFAEEEFLRKKFGSEYEEWAARTPAFVPRFKNWKRPELSFCLSKVIKKEYLGFYGIITVFTILESSSRFMIEGKVAPAPFWRAIFLFGTVLFITIRILNKKTDIFHVKGRS
ncbi:MAG: DUF1295 domain-containing protein [Candidatus Krumholzibacteriota bacterium]|nr:DUF1295 domain-containing protein [Candidatus Krumholzibacteriota bacterium]